MAKKLIKKYDMKRKFSSFDFDFKNFYSVKDDPEIITKSELLQKNLNKILINSYSDFNYLIEKFNNICNVIETDSQDIDSNNG